MQNKLTKEGEDTEEDIILNCTIGIGELICQLVLYYQLIM